MCVFFFFFFWLHYRYAPRIRGGCANVYVVRICTFVNNALDSLSECPSSIFILRYSIIKISKVFQTEYQHLKRLKGFTFGEKTLLDSSSLGRGMYGDLDLTWVRAALIIRGTVSAVYICFWIDYASTRDLMFLLGLTQQVDAFSAGLIRKGSRNIEIITT